MADRHREEIRTFAHLAGLLASDFPREVLDRRLRIVVGDDVLSSPTGQALALTVARIAPRICHRVDFVCPTAECLSRLVPLLAADKFSASGLADLGRLIWPEGAFTADDGGEVDLVLGIGAPGDISAGAGSDGAIIKFGDGAEVDVGEDPFAALTAAAMACAVATSALYPQLMPKVELPAELRLDGGPFGGPLDGAMRQLERPFIAGVGAVGCALLYALIVADASGTVVLVDPDKVKDSNLMRYVLFDTRDLEIAKVDAAKRIIDASGVDIHVERDRAVLQGYLDEHGDERKRATLVVSAVDTYEARRDIAGWLPKAIINAGTTPRDFTVSRHGFGDGYACLACLYPPRPADALIESAMARELGLSTEDVIELRRQKSGMTPELLARVAAARGAAADVYKAYVGEPLDSFYNKEFCAQVAAQTPRGEAIAPLAHGSALAGFMLAQSLVTAGLGDTRHFRMDVVSGLATPIRRNRRARPECVVCSKTALRDVYRVRWNSDIPT